MTRPLEAPRSIAATAPSTSGIRKSSHVEAQPVGLRLPGLDERASAGASGRKPPRASAPKPTRIASTESRARSRPGEASSPRRTPRRLRPPRNRRHAFRREVRFERGRRDPVDGRFVGGPVDVEPEATNPRTRSGRGSAGRPRRARVPAACRRAGPRPGSRRTRPPPARPAGRAAWRAPGTAARRGRDRASWRRDRRRRRRAHSRIVVTSASERATIASGSSPATISPWFWRSVTSVFPSRPVPARARRRLSISLASGSPGSVSAPTGLHRRTGRGRSLHRRSRT